MEEKHKKISLAALLFHAVVVALILSGNKTPKMPSFPGILFQELMRGTDKSFIPLGSEFEPYKPLLPPGETVTFIMDYPFHPYGQNIGQLYTAQSYLTPIILSYEPKQRAAIVYCSTAQIAEKRLKETGYRLLATLGDGKGIAAKL